MPTERPSPPIDHPTTSDVSLAPPSLSPSVEPPRLGILAKLLGTTAIAVGAAVLSLSAYFSAQQLAQQETALQRRARVYGELVSEQAKSSVAFTDRETAREVLQAVTRDHSVTGIAIFTEHGLLHMEGQLSRVALAASRLAGTQLFSLPESYLAVAPIQSLEGPQGRVVFELSKRELLVAQRAVIVGSLFAGLFSLSCALALGWLLSRSLARRVKTIALATSAVATGDLSREPIIDPTRDEVGVLARGFNTMVRQLRALLAQMQKSAREEKQRLEWLVRERTHALDARNAELRLVMDNVDQGFFTVSRAGKMSDERSACVAHWFGEPVPGQDFFEYLERVAPKRSATFQFCFEQLFDGFLPVDVCLGQFPERIEVADRTYKFQVRPIFTEGEHFEQVLMVISDITPVIERERAEAEERETIALFSKLVKDRQGVIDFFDDTSHIVEEIKASREELASFRRHVHTLKGNAGLFGLTSIVGACHDLEEALEGEHSVDRDRFEHLLEAVRRLTIRFKEFLGDTSGTRFVLEQQDRDELLQAIEQSAPKDNLRKLVLSWENESIRTRLSRAAEQLQALAGRLGKDPMTVHIECQAIRQPHNDWQPLWSQLAHVLRNAVDHGIELPDERRVAGKPAISTVTLRGRSDQGQLLIEVEDSGRGIDWSRVETKARELGILAGPCGDRDRLSEVLFAAGFSTKAQANDVSGRGVGLAALYETVKARGGRISIESELGRGTRFTVHWPQAQNDNSLRDTRYLSA